MSSPASSLTGFESTITGVIQADPTQSRFYIPFTAQTPGRCDRRRMGRAAGAGEGDDHRHDQPGLREDRRILSHHLSAQMREGGGGVGAAGRRGLLPLPHPPADDDRPDARRDPRDRPEGGRAHPRRDGRRSRRRRDIRRARRSSPSCAPIRNITRRRPRNCSRPRRASPRRSTARCPALFHRLPRLPYGVKPIPAEIAEGTTTAYYGQGSPQNGLSGTYFVNTSKLDQRPAVGAAVADRARGGAGPSQPDRAATGTRPAAAAHAPGQLHRLYRRVGAVRRDAGQRDGAVRHARETDGAAELRHVARVPAGRRHRHPCQGLDQGARGRLHARQYRAVGGEHRCRGQSLHQLAGAGARLQAGRAQDPRAARTRRRGRWARGSILRRSTTRCSNRDRCRSTCSTRMSPRGSRRKAERSRSSRHRLCDNFPRFRGTRLRQLRSIFLSTPRTGPRKRS